MGHQGHAGALLVMTAEGILRCSGARRMPDKLRWSAAGWETGSMGCGIETEGTSSARFGVRRKRDEGTVAIEADIRTTTARTTHVHYRGGCEKVRTD